MSEDADRDSSQGRKGGETAHQQDGSGVSLPEAACRAMPVRVGVEATDELLALLSTAGLNALPDPDEHPPRRTIVEVQAESPGEAGEKIREILGDVPIEPAE